MCARNRGQRKGAGREGAALFFNARECYITTSVESEPQDQCQDHKLERKEHEMKELTNTMVCFMIELI